MNATAAHTGRNPRNSANEKCGSNNQEGIAQSARTGVSDLALIREIESLINSEPHKIVELLRREDANFSASNTSVVALVQEFFIRRGILVTRDYRDSKINLRTHLICTAPPESGEYLGQTYQIRYVTPIDENSDPRARLTWIAGRTAFADLSNIFRSSVDKILDRPTKKGANPLLKFADERLQNRALRNAIFCQMGIRGLIESSIEEVRNVIFAETSNPQSATRPNGAIFELVKASSWLRNQIPQDEDSSPANFALCERVRTDASEYGSTIRLMREACDTGDYDLAITIYSLFHGCVREKMSTDSGTDSQRDQLNKVDNVLRYLGTDPATIKEFTQTSLKLLEGDYDQDFFNEDERIAIIRENNPSAQIDSGMAAQETRQVSREESNFKILTDHIIARLRMLQTVSSFFRDLAPSELTTASGQFYNWGNSTPLRSLQAVVEHSTPETGLIATRLITNFGEIINTFNQLKQIDPWIKGNRAFTRLCETLEDFRSRVLEVYEYFKNRREEMERSLDSANEKVVLIPPSAFYASIAVKLSQSLNDLLSPKYIDQLARSFSGTIGSIRQGPQTPQPAARKEPKVSSDTSNNELEIAEIENARELLLVAGLSEESIAGVMTRLTAAEVSRRISLLDEVVNNGKFGNPGDPITTEIIESALGLRDQEFSDKIAELTKLAEIDKARELLEILGFNKESIAGSILTLTAPEILRRISVLENEKKGPGIFTGELDLLQTEIIEAVLELKDHEFDAYIRNLNNFKSSATEFSLGETPSTIMPAQLAQRFLRNK